MGVLTYMRFHPAVLELRRRLPGAQVEAAYDPRSMGVQLRVALDGRVVTGWAPDVWALDPLEMAKIDAMVELVRPEPVEAKVVQPGDLPELPKPRTDPVIPLEPKPTFVGVDMASGPDQSLVIDLEPYKVKP